MNWGDLLVFCGMFAVVIALGVAEVMSTRRWLRGDGYKHSTLSSATRLKIANAQKGKPLHSKRVAPGVPLPPPLLEEPENAVHDFLQRCIREFEEELAVIERPKWGVLEWRHQRPNENRAEYLARLEYGPNFDRLTAEAKADWYGRYRKGG